MISKSGMASAILVLLVICGVSFSVACPGGLSGSGTSGSPCMITNCTQLQSMNASLGLSYALNNNVDCTYDTQNPAGALYNGGAGFAPVGDGSVQFTGTFDGQNHTITGLFINRPSQDYVGLFGSTNGGVNLSNVGLLNVNVTGNVHIGGLVGYGNHAIISSSYSTGNVSGNDRVGGLAGESQALTISNSYSTGSISSGDYAGGLVGLFYSSTINNSYFTGNVSGSGSMSGGLVGESYLSIIISNSYSTGTVSGGSSLGGLIGFDVGPTTISNSFWDLYLSGQSNCTGNSGNVSGCTGADGDGTNVAYFYNSSNAPLSSWDFTNIWLAHADTYPTLLPPPPPPYVGCVDLSNSSTYQGLVSGSMGSGFSVTGSIALCTDTYAFSGVTALTVAADDVAIDCNGSTLSGDNSTDSYGIYSSNLNTTVMNCVIGNFSDGVYFNGASNGTIQNTSAGTTYASGSDTNGIGILLDNGAQYNVITGSSGTSASNIGIYLNTVTNNTLVNCTGTSLAAGTGINVYSSSNITLINTTGTSDSDAGIFLSTDSNVTLINSTGASDSGNGIYLSSCSYCDIANSSGTTNSGSGIVVSGSDNSNITDSSGISNVNAGIEVVSGSNNAFTNSVGTSDSNAGIIIISSSGNTFAGSTGNSSSAGFGIYLIGASDNTFTGCSGTGSPGLELTSSCSNNMVANSTLDGDGGAFAVELQSGSNTLNVFINNTLLNASTLLSLDGSASANTICWNNFTDVGAPTYYVQDGNGGNYYNSSLCGNGSSVDSEGNIWANVMDGTARIMGSVNSSGFPLLFIGNSSYNDSVSHGKTINVIDNAPLTADASHCHALMNISQLDIPAALDCPGATYLLQENVTSSQNALTMAADNVTLDCLGNSITGPGGSYDGIHSESTVGTVIRNCTISDFQDGIYFLNTSYGQVVDDTLGSDFYGVYLDSCDNNTFTNTSCTSTSGNGAYLVSSSGNDFTNFTGASDSSYGIYLQFSSINTFVGSTGTSNSNAGFEVASGSNNTFTDCVGTSDSSAGIVIASSSGNTFTGSTGNSISAGYGIYIAAASNNTFINFTAAGPGSGIYMVSGSDYNNFTNSTSAVASNYALYMDSCDNNLFTNTSCTSTSGNGAYLVSSSGNEFANFTGASDSSYGIYLTSSPDNRFINSTGSSGSGGYGIILASSPNSSIVNSTASSVSSAGLVISNSDGSTFANGLVSGQEYIYGALLISDSRDNTVANSTIDGNGGNYALTVQSGNPSGNRIINNTLRGATTLAYLDSFASNNTFYWNNFTAGASLYVDDPTGGNFFNTSMAGHGEGNIYADVISGADRINGTTLSLIGIPGLYVGSGGPDYPYNENSTGGRMLGATDYAPLTLNNTPFPVACGDTLLADHAYYLTADLTSLSSDCFDIHANNVTIDCQDHSITGPGGSAGVYAESVNGTVVRNCTIVNFWDGVYFENASRGQVVDNTFGSDFFGVDLESITSDESTGSHSNNLSGNTFIDNEFGFEVYYSDNNLISHNQINDTINVNYGSCPLLYSWNGTGYGFVDDIASPGILGITFGNGQYRQPTPGDYAKISPDQLQEQNGAYNVRLTEEYNELSYLDQVSLMTVDHAPDVDVFATPVWADQATLYTASKAPAAPVSCTDSNGEDCLSEVLHPDGQYTNGTQDAANWLQVDLGDLRNASDIKLILTGVSIFGADAPNPAGRFIRVQDVNGSWVDAYSASQIAMFPGFPRTLAINMSGRFPIDNYTVRIGFNSAFFDYVAVDTTPQGSVTVHTYNATSADLHYRGYSKTASGIIPYPDYYRVKTARLFQDASGSFTKYGDVAPLLGAKDDEFVVMNHGDEMSLSFPASAVPAGTERDFLLYNWVYYKPADYIYGGTVDPLPFAAMSNYPYGAGESYPSDAAHQSYLADWNTRHLGRPMAAISTARGISAVGGVPDRRIAGTGISLPFSVNNTVSYNVIDGGPFSSGLYVNFEDSTRIIGNNISNVGTGIDVEDSSRMLVQGNIITDTTGDAIGIYTVDSSNVTGNVIDSVSEGVYAEVSHDLLITGNNITNADYGVDFSNSSSNTVSRNDIEAIGTYAVDLESDCYGNIFTNNTLSGSDFDIYSESSSSGNRFLHNIIAGDFWVDDQGGFNYFNDSRTGNIYYLSNGTGSWEVYNITDFNNDNWADAGSDRPFNSTTAVGIDGFWSAGGADYHPWTNVSSQPPPRPPSSGGRAGATQAVTLGETLNCSSGVLTVVATSSDTGVEGLGVKLFSTTGFSYSATETTDSQGEASFTLPASGEYSVYTAASGNYQSADLGPFQLTLCQAQNVTPPQNGTQNQTQGAGNQSGQQNITPPQNVTPPAKQTQPPGNQTSAQLAANDSISAAQAAIDAAKKAGKDTTAAEAKLKEAKDAYNSGDYAQATTLSEQAISLASAAAPAKQNATGPSVAQNPASGGSPLWTVIFVLVLLAILAGGYWLLSARKPKGR